MSKTKNKKPSDLSVIVDVETLTELAKFDHNIRAYALIKVKDQYLADDIVNDMYIKAHDMMEKGKKLSGGYIILMIGSIYLNKLNYEKRYNGNDNPKTTFFNDLSHLISEASEVFSPAHSLDSEDRKFYINNANIDLLDIEDDDTEIIKKEKQEEQYEFIEQLIEEKLNWYEQKILRYSLEMTIVELSQRSGIQYSSLLGSYNKLKKKLGLENVKIKKNK